jgi:ABC-type antimicrobial peptide transport system permease subunit
MAATKFSQVSSQERVFLGWGGGLVGLGTGSLLVYAIYIFEKSHPLPQVLNSNGDITNAYPSMVLTILVVFAASFILGFGISALGAALLSTRHETEPARQDQQR